MRCKEYIVKIYLAGGNDIKTLQKFDRFNCKYILETFYDIRKWNKETLEYFLGMGKIENGCFLLDSGAFTFMNSGKKVHWKAYVDEYIEFINKYDIQQFFELDLYTLPDVGIQQTIKMRRYIEHYTGKKSIPVFHACMGMDMYREICQEYDYIGIGASGLTEECRWVHNKKILRQMVRIASRYGTKVHGLGYTRRENINREEIPFYSIDSISWRLNTGMGYEYKTRHGAIIRTHPKGRNDKSREQLENKNLKAWCEIQNIKDAE